MARFNGTLWTVVLVLAAVALFIFVLAHTTVNFH